jgi:hypothetical protein
VPDAAPRLTRGGWRRRIARVVVVHLEAINHCPDTREFVRAQVPEAVVPDDGETIPI